MDFRIELRDRDFVLQDVIENEAMNIRWSYSRIGGCGDFSFSVPRDFDEQGNIGGFFDVRIYKRANKGTYTLLYAGEIEDRIPNKSDPDFIEVKGFGYVGQLSSVVVNTAFYNAEISTIVTAVLDNFIVPNTDITYSAADIGTTGFTADIFEFNTTADKVMQTLAETTGSREWGVDKNKNFFFKKRSEEMTHYYFIGNKIKSYQSIDSFRNIVNRIYIEGGEVGGTIFTYTINNVDSQNKFGLREDIIQNASIVSATVALQYGNAILVERSDVARRARLEIFNDETQLEATIPLGLIVPKTAGVRYGEKEYGTFLYSGDVSYQISKIDYQLDNNQNISTTIDLGQVRPQLTEEIEQITYKLEQLRASRA
jgi:hypothetical protein